MWMLTDGVFNPRPSYFGPDAERPEHAGLFAPGGELTDLPVACFLVTGIPDRLVLVDAGLGPHPAALSDGGYQRYSGYGNLVGGDLLTQFAETGYRPEHVTDVVITHLHNDHHGWLTHSDEGSFPQARLWIGAGDWEFSLSHPDSPMPGYARRRLAAFAERGQVELLRGGLVAPGVRTLYTPGHTPGSMTVEVHGGGERLLLLGDAVTCPVQHAHPDWHSVGDLDVELADRSRATLWHELAQPATRGLGAHFPRLTPGSVTGTPPRWRAPSSDLPPAPEDLHGSTVGAVDGAGGLPRVAAERRSAPEGEALGDLRGTVRSVGRG